MPIIKSIRCRKVLNSNVAFTNEFIVEFDDGAVGIGASPEGETVSIYEDRQVLIDSDAILCKMKDEGCLGDTFDQQSFDDYLERRIPLFGRNNAFGLSLAFFNARKVSESLFSLFGKEEHRPVAPCLCCNILNGGWHAYTNPVLSDFPEFLLVARDNNIEEVCANYNEIQRVVHERLAPLPKSMVSGNPVSCFSTRDNRECIDFLLRVRDDLKLSDAFDLMIDASAGDLWIADRYQFALTDQSRYSSEQLCMYWMDLVEQYDLRFLEDPFQETDFLGWRRLTSGQDRCFVIGDNVYSTDARKIVSHAAEKLTTGVIIKPNQAGTVTGVQRALAAIAHAGQIAITSHRSISTEDTFLSALSCVHDVNFMKIGPFTSDYSAIIRLNAIIRLTDY